MPRALQIIFGALFFFFVVTSLFPELLVGVVALTFGFGLPILFLNTVFLYFLAALPVLIALNRQPRAWAQIAIAATVVPAVAIIPPLLNKTLAAVKMEWIRRHDISTIFAQAPKSVEIEGDSLSYGGTNNPLTDAPCDALCQRLLLSRSVELVRVRSRGLEKPAQLDYRIEQRQSCPDAFGNHVTVTPEARDAIASGVCFVPRSSDATAVDTRIVIQKTTAREPQNLLQDMAAVTGAEYERQTLEILTAVSGQWTPRLRKTQVRFLLWQMPTTMSYVTCSTMCIGQAVLAKTDGVFNRFDPVQTALDALQIGKREPEKLLDATSRVLALLDHAGDSLTENQRQLIKDWVGSFPCSQNVCAPAPARDLDLLQRLIRDRRVTDFGFISAVVLRNRDFVVANLDLLLDEMEARGASSNFSNQIGAIVAKLDNDVLRTRRERILALINASDWKWSRGIAIVSGRLGVDTRSLISRRLRDRASAQNAALAACTADEPIGRALVPDLLAYLNDLPISDDQPEDAARDVVTALARFGHFDEANAIYLARFPKFGNPALLRQIAVAGVNNVNACYGLVSFKSGALPK